MKSVTHHQRPPPTQDQRFHWPAGSLTETLTSRGKAEPESNTGFKPTAISAPPTGFSLAPPPLTAMAFFPLPTQGRQHSQDGFIALLRRNSAMRLLHSSTPEPSGPFHGE